MLLPHISTSSPSAALVVAGGCIRRGMHIYKISASSHGQSPKPLRSLPLSLSLSLSPSQIYVIFVCNYMIPSSKIYKCDCMKELMLCIMCRYAVLGAGFAGLSVTWHLLQVHIPSLSICISLC